MNRKPPSKGSFNKGRSGGPRDRRDDRGPRRNDRDDRRDFRDRRDDRDDRRDFRGRRDDRDDRRDSRGRRDDRDERRDFRGPRDERRDFRGRRDDRDDRRDFKGRREDRDDRRDHKSYRDDRSTKDRDDSLWGKHPKGTSKEQGNRSDRWERSVKPAPKGTWFIAGLNGVREAFSSKRVRVRQLFVDPTHRDKETQALASEAKCTVTEVEDRETPFGPLAQGIAALVTQPEEETLEDLIDQLKEREGTPLLVALDQVEDPMNLGQILRTCEGAGVDGVILMRDRSVHLNQTAAQISQGAYAWVPVVEVTNLRHSLELAKRNEYWVIGCEGGEKSQKWSSCDFTSPTVLVFGAEGKGLRDLTQKTCDVLAALPMRGRINSLNVGAAVSAFLYEVMRQRNY